MISNNNIFEILWKRKVLLIIISIVAVVLSAVFSGPAFITPKFKSFAVIYPSNIEPFSEESPSEQLLQVLQSTDIKQDLIDSFNLAKHYKIDTDKRYYHTKLMQEVEDNVNVYKTSYESVVVEVTDKDRELARDMVNACIYFFNFKMKNIYEQNKLEELKGIETVLVDKKKYIDSLDNRLDSLRKKYHFFDYTLQSKEYTRQYLRSTAEGRNNAGVKNMEEFFANLETYGGEFLLLGGYLSSANGVYNKLLADRDEIMTELNQEISFVNIISKPMPADKKCYPIRWLIVSGSFLAALFLSVLILLFIENR